MELCQITPLILTYNEAPNLARTLAQLRWASRIVIVDSYSTDETLAIALSVPQVQVYQRAFDTHGGQWNFGLEQVTSEWVLSLDADYFVTEELQAEIAALPETELADGYFIRFKYCVFGKPLRGTILPPRQALFRRSRAQYIDDGHTQLLQLNGTSATLSGYIYHDDRKPLSRWLWAQDRYLIIEDRKLRSTPDRDLSWSDRLRKRKILAPFVVFLYCAILKGGILDGWHGWYYAFQRAIAELLLSLRLLEAELERTAETLLPTKEEEHRQEENQTRLPD